MFGEHFNNIGDDGQEILLLEVRDPPLDYFIHSEEDPDPEINWVDAEYRGPDIPQGLIPHLTTLALHYVMEHRGSNAGGFRIKASPAKRLVQQLAGAFPIQSKFDTTQVFERSGIIALLGDDPFDGSDDLVLHVEARNDFPSSEIPAFLRQLSGSAIISHGIFTSTDAS